MAEVATGRVTAAGGRRRPPGDSGLVALSDLRSLRRDPIELLLRKFRTHGDVFMLTFISSAIGTAYFVANPDDVEYVLRTNQSNYIKAPTYRPIRNFLGDGLLTAEGDAW